MYDDMHISASCHLLTRSYLLDRSQVRVSSTIWGIWGGSRTGRGKERARKGITEKVEKRIATIDKEEESKQEEEEHHQELGNYFTKWRLLDGIDKKEHAPIITKLASSGLRAKMLDVIKVNDDLLSAVGILANLAAVQMG